VTNIVPLRAPVNQDLVKAVEGLLERAKSGELTGVVVLCNHPGENASHMWSGAMSVATALLVFEHWKRKAMDAVGQP
jgi:hypothetical protein